ncbi:magnesium transporter CorA family protein [Arenibaculum pallidiluteum]|uniref:magnesium transporter CorA family protein n=1 Tax=Arenibaculum pallidiluteum TaxID=2812559 RepID=UPI001F3D4ED7|nr:magnesium transporter CorA family protein [Arenibaculum pallidiluteum]
MIRAYLLRPGGGPAEVELRPGDALPEGTAWLDLLRPTEAERRHADALLGIETPTHEDMKEIEVSSRLYVENGAAYLTTPLITGADSPDPMLGPLTCVMTERCLLTVRFSEPKSLETFRTRVLRQPELLRSTDDAMLGLMDAVADRAADVLEFIGGQLDALGRQVFADPPSAGRPGPPKAELTDVIRGIGRVGDLTHKLRDSLAGLDRLVAFLTTVSTGRLNKEQKAALKTIIRDLRSLGEHAAFLAHQTSFLLDATLGAINVEQNAIIKIFSVMAVVFLPPTLIASIYGMNFHHIPELDWPWGYPLALCLMVVSAILPLLYFRKRGWL